MPVGNVTGRGEQHAITPQKSTSSHLMGKTESILHVFMKSSKVSHRDQARSWSHRRLRHKHLSLPRTRSECGTPSKEKRCEKSQGEKSGVTGRGAGGQASVRDMLEQGKEMPSGDAQTQNGSRPEM